MTLLRKNYDLLLQLLKIWPVDKTKGSRCYGLHIRAIARNGFPSGNIFPGSNSHNQERLQSLLRMASNMYGKQYPYRKEIAASGYKLDEIRNRLNEQHIHKFLKRIEQ